MSFDWKWYLKDLKPDKDVKVFSCFSCGGGSSMGYKRAGFQVIGNCEIDPKMNKIYNQNLHPKYSYVADLRDFNKMDDLPEELYRLDILDGSPPCTTFSDAGQREATWGKEKKFREGQKKQTLDDLFFVFLDTVEKLQPKIVIAENVPGLIKGNAKGYVNEIVRRFQSAGYEVQMFLLNAAKMNVPQARERVFFIANNRKYPKLKLEFNEEPILFGEVREEKGDEISDGVQKELMKHRKPCDMKVAHISKRVRKADIGFTVPINWDNRVCYTLAAGGGAFRGYDGMMMTANDCRNVSSFPQDYDFGDNPAKYVCGMSVPPNMMANIASEIYKQWLSGDMCAC